MRLKELQEADEVFLTGTAAEIIGVTRIDSLPIGSGKVGPVTRAIATEFRRVVASNAPEN